MENRYVMEMLNRQKIEETLRAAERNHMIREATQGRSDGGFLRRVAAVLNGGRSELDATGAREVPGL